MKNLLHWILVCIGIAGACVLPFCASAQTKNNPDLPPTTTIATEDGWQLLLPIEKKACTDCPYFYGLVDTETRDTSFMSYPATMEVWVRPGWQWYAGTATRTYDLYLHDTLFASTDTIYMEQVFPSLVSMRCVECDPVIVQVPVDSGRLGQRIRYMTNVPIPMLEGGMFSTNDPRFASADAYTVQFVKR